MTADELIDSYVADVVLLLPRKHRRDVAQELRMLLREEVDAAASGQGSREQAARALLADFGRPADVAARYGSPVTLIDPADTRRFLTLAMAGAVLIPFGAILNALTGPADPQRDLRQAIEKAWPGAGPDSGDHLLRPWHARADKPGLADQDGLRWPRRAGGVRGIRL